MRRHQLGLIIYAVMLAFAASHAASQPAHAPPYINLNQVTPSDALRSVIYGWDEINAVPRGVAVDVLGEVFIANPGSSSPKPVTPMDRSLTLTSAGAGTFASSNSGRQTFTFQVPACLASGLYVSWSGIAGNGTVGSYFYPANTVLVSLDVTLVGLGAITYYAPAETGTCVVPATEG